MSTALERCRKRRKTQNSSTIRGIRPFVSSAAPSPVCRQSSDAVCYPDDQHHAPLPQADFAPNTIDFLHRIGRTARAANSGRVTSLFREQNRPLVEVIRRYIEEGVPLEAAFSRARSFSRKLKRMGGVFVPRGMSVSAVRGGDAPEAEDGGETAAAELVTAAAEAAAAAGST
jgi:hypothetical protein